MLTAKIAIISTILASALTIGVGVKVYVDNTDINQRLDAIETNTASVADFVADMRQSRVNSANMARKDIDAMRQELNRGQQQHPSKW